MVDMVYSFSYIEFLLKLLIGTQSMCGSLTSNFLWFEPYRRKIKQFYLRVLVCLEFVCIIL